MRCVFLSGARSRRVLSFSARFQVWRENEEVCPLREVRWIEWRRHAETLFAEFHPVLQTLLATLFTWGVTAAGAVTVFFTKEVSRSFLDVGAWGSPPA